MKLSLHTIAAAVTFALAGSVYAQSTTTPGSTRMDKAPATSSSASESPEKRIDREHKAATDACKPLKGNAQDVCKAEADGKRDVAKAELKVQQKDTPENRRDLAEARAKATYNVEKEKCDDLKGDAKDACQNQAKANRDRAQASAKAK